MIKLLRSHIATQQKGTLAFHHQTKPVLRLNELWIAIIVDFFQRLLSPGRPKEEMSQDHTIHLYSENIDAMVADFMEQQV